MIFQATLDGLMDAEGIFQHTKSMYSLLQYIYVINVYSIYICNCRYAILCNFIICEYIYICIYNYIYIYMGGVVWM